MLMRPAILPYAVCPMQYAAAVEYWYQASFLFGLTLSAEYVTLEGNIVRQKIFVPTCHFALDCRS